MSYEVSLKGGPLSGPLFREDYLPGRIYTYPASEAEYVEMLRLKGRFNITEKPEPSSAPAEKAEPKAETPKASEAKPAPKGKGGK